MLNPENIFGFLLPQVLCIFVRRFSNYWYLLGTYVILADLNAEYLAMVWRRQYRQRFDAS
jgi:hypothetical protein